MWAKNSTKVFQPCKATCSMPPLCEGGWGWVPEQDPAADRQAGGARPQPRHTQGGTLATFAVTQPWLFCNLCYFATSAISPPLLFRCLYYLFRTFAISLPLLFQNICYLQPTLFRNNIYFAIFVLSPPSLFCLFLPCFVSFSSPLSLRRLLLPSSIYLASVSTFYSSPPPLSPFLSHLPFQGVLWSF